MLTTKETVSGLRKINSLVDDLVKQFPTLTHAQIAKLLIDESRDLVETLREEIETARKAGKNPFQKAGSLARFEKYGPIVEHVADMLVDLGKTEIVKVEGEEPQDEKIAA